MIGFLFEVIGLTEIASAAISLPSQLAHGFRHTRPFRAINCGHE